MRYLACIALLAACGSKSPSPTGPGSATPALPDVPFDKLSHEQKAELMQDKVVPALEPVFKQHDAKRFAEFGCETCHGKGAEQRHFRMPNPELPQLSRDMSKFKKEDIEWMATQVKPAMAKVLQLKEWTPEDQTGFGCSGCHSVAKE